MNKNKIILIILFALPIVIYLIFASAKHNSLFLPVISKNNQDVPFQWKTLEGKSATLEDKITVLGFPGSNIAEVKGNLFNLNQKIYNKYFGFKDFQMVMVMPKGTEGDCKQILRKLESVTEDLSGWNFVFTTPDSIQQYYNTFHFVGQLDQNHGTPAVYIIDKNLSHRGRKGKNKMGEEEFKESYNTVSAAELHNEMGDDVKILLREYRLALKKNDKRKDEFRDKITEEIESGIND